MSRILLFSLLGILAGVPTGWYFGAAAMRDEAGEEAREEDFEPANLPAPSFGNGEDRPLLAELEFEIETLQSVLRETDRRYRILLQSVEAAGFPEFLEIGVGNTLELQRDAQAFFGLTNRKAREVDAIGAAVYDQIREWESANAILIETTDAGVTYQIPANAGLSETLRNRYFEELAVLVGPDDAEILYRSAADHFTSLEMTRVVRVDTSSPDGSSSDGLFFETDYIAADGTLVSRESGTLSSVPDRYQHLIAVE